MAITGETPGGGNDPTAFLLAFKAHAEAGDRQAALLAASEACHAAPHLPQPHYAYGQAWMAMDEPARAEQAFAAALGLAPQWADAWVNYGIARYRQGAIEDAKTAMRRALRAEPGHAAATANLGGFLRITGEVETAESLLHDAIARDPANAGARLNLVADLLQEERAAEALALLTQAAPPDEARTRRHWLLQQALALSQLGRFAEMAAVLQALSALGPIPPDIAPLWHWRHVLLALGQGRAADARAAAEQVEAALGAMGPDAVPEHRIMAHYDLARFWSGHNEPSRAFGFWVGAHAILRTIQPFSRADYLAFVDANIAAFDAARFAAGPRAGNADPAPVFIVGMPRSGTTLCHQILAAHAQVHGAGERSALSYAFARLGGERDTPQAAARIAALDAPALDIEADRYLGELHSLAPGKSRIVDKMPGNFLYLGLVGLMLPGARIIHCVRDPRDIGLSIFTYRFFGVHAYAHDLGDLGWTIAQQNRLMQHWRAALPNPILTVRLADWVEDFDGTLARVLAHLDLPPDENCAQFHKSPSRVRTVSRAQVRQPVNARGLGRWPQFAGELAPLIEELERGGMLQEQPDEPPKPPRKRGKIVSKTP